MNDKQAENLFTEDNRAFRMMTEDAVKMLAAKDPQEIAEKAGVSYDPETQQFTVPSLGQTYTLSYPEYRPEPAMDSWHHLTMLHYLNLADGTPVRNVLSTMAQMPSGMVRGGKFDQTAARALEAYAAAHSEVEIRSNFEKLGASFPETNADLTVQVMYLPRVPLTINIWFADEEFPPSARLLVDESIAHYLTIEDAVTVGDYLLNLL